MSFTILITRDFDQMSQVAADLVVADIRRARDAGRDHVLGLATGNSPTGLYKHLAKAANAGGFDPGRVRTFNLDEYVGLPGENAQQRTLHPESYSCFMVRELFGLMTHPFRETNVPWGTLVDQTEFEAALAAHPEDVEVRGAHRGRALVITPRATGVLAWIRDHVLAGYADKVAAAGGIDLHVVGVGGRGHVAFHESGIPFDVPPVMLVSLDDSTIDNAVADGHFASRADSPRYAVSMSARLVYRARRVVLLANGSRKTGPVAESILGEVTCDVPVSLGQQYVEQGGALVYVLDEEAAAEVLGRRAEVAARGYEVRDLRDQPPAVSLAELAFTRDPLTGRLG